ncbi:MAG: hypothetical protein K0R92_231 [Lachnospiraceae bacterium]|jgi:hypothetical protein|nr:hypothetical protein [Lachnospiraceae bacterium]
MKKVGIITIPDYNNYGNRLQNYAVKRVFEKLGYTVETLELNDKAFPNYKARKWKLWLKKIKLFPIVFLFIWLKEGFYKAQRYKCFEKFTLRYLSVTFTPTYNESIVNNLKNEYSYFVLGSDQIWHPHINSTPTLYFGEFAKQVQRICFAPSFGVTKISDKYRDIVIKYLVNINKLSVREESGAKIIKEITGRDATVLIDPTMMLNAEEWDEIAQCPKNKPKQKYILGCFLGHMNTEYKEYINEVSLKIGVTIFHIAQINNKEGYVTGPSEFIWYLKNSAIVCTDSFHTVVFAILFNKPFIVFPRLTEDNISDGLDSRLDTLLNKFCLTNRKNGLVDKNSLFTCDYGNVRKTLNHEREQVYNFFSDL